jgi:hypothetical protein
MQHLRKMGLHRTSLCKCGLSEQMPEHILQTCPNMSSRQHFWPELTALKTKLWGQRMTWGKQPTLSSTTDWGSDWSWPNARRRPSWPKSFKIVQTYWHNHSLRDTFGDHINTLGAKRRRSTFCCFPAVGQMT